ncbi:MAG: hypothetical protein NTY77_12960 [Elusimicrobia bacterium]|nr:hypothetical protein [Elusimicrobiota bacterium]
MRRKRPFLGGLAALAAGLLLSSRLLAADAVRVTGEGREASGSPVVLPGSPSLLGSAGSLTGSLAAPSLTGGVLSRPAPEVRSSGQSPAVITPSALIATPAPAGPAKPPAAVLQENTADIQDTLAHPAAEEKASGASAAVFDNQKRPPATASEGVPAVLAEPAEAGGDLRPGLSKAAPIDHIVQAAAGRSFSGVAIHQEQEGNLTLRDARDSSGSVFEYYRPVEMRPDLVAQVLAGMNWVERTAYQFHRLTRVLRPKDAWNVWDDMPLDSKLKYVSLLDAAVTRERGRDEVWDGPLFRLLQRSPRAPPYVAQHPHLEEPRLFRGEHPFARYLEPEIVTDREHPAATAREAIGRTKAIIADTGHAGTHYHVFLRAEPAVLQGQMPALQSMLQLINNVLFAQAAVKSYDNLFHPFLLPWHQGRSERVNRLVNEALPSASRPDHRDLDNEKFAFVAFRYWGLEDGRMVVSFELRGANIPWKSQKRPGGGQFDADLPKPERDYSEVERYLSFLVLYADRLSRGAAPGVSEPALRLDLAAAEQTIAERARQKGMQPGDYLDLAAFSRLMFANSVNQPQAAADRAGMVHPSLLLPFAAGASFGPNTQSHLRHLTDVFLEESARLKAMSRGGSGVPDAGLRNVKYMFWEAYGGWARGLLGQDQARFDELFRSL